MKHQYLQIVLDFCVIENYQDSDGKFYTEVLINGKKNKFETSQFFEAEMNALCQFMYGLKENGLLK